MNIEFTGDKMIYLQLADWIEDNIIAGVFGVGTQIPSAADMAATFRINHITALKGMNLLAEEGILTKRRGMGMYVTSEACMLILEKRKEQFHSEYIMPLIKEAKKLGISQKELQDMIATNMEEK